MRQFLSTLLTLSAGLGITIALFGFRFSGEPWESTAPVSSQPTRIYFADHISPTHQKIIDLFNEQYRGRIEVVPVNLPFNKFTTNERKELLARSLRSKSEKLDVFAVDLIWVPRFAKWAEPLDAYFTAQERSGLLPHALQSCVYRGSFVAAPMYIDIGVMYYRRDIIARLPDAAAIERKLADGITWSELLDIRARLRHRAQPFYVFQAKDYEGLICNFLEMRVAIDSSGVSATRLDLADPSSLAALRKMAEMLRSGVSPREVCDFDENMSYRYMLDNDVPFVRGWPNFVENFRFFYPDTAKLSTIRRARVPRGPGSPSRSVFGGWNLMVSKSSSRKSEAITFIKFVESPEIQHVLFEDAGYIPILNRLYADPAYVKEHPDLADYRRLLNDGFHRPSMEDYTRVSDIVSRHVHLVLKGEMSAEEAARRAAALIDSRSVLVK